MRVLTAAIVGLVLSASASVAIETAVVTAGEATTSYSELDGGNFWATLDKGARLFVSCGKAGSSISVTFSSQLSFPDTNDSSVNIRVSSGGYTAGGGLSGYQRKADEVDVMLTTYSSLAPLIENYARGQSLTFTMDGPEVSSVIVFSIMTEEARADLANAHRNCVAAGRL